jgi:mono/diheme cytochrome c family protein
MPRNTLFLLIAVTCAALSTLTQSLADDKPSAGRQVAMEICSHCHRVADGQLAPLQNVPSFAEIANRSSTTASSLKVFLRSKHKRKRMPDFIMSNSDIEDVITYILSLKQQ